jgi:hypothetical protein
MGTIIFILAAVLIILAILNYVKYTNALSSSSTTTSSASCSQTTFGCCPNGVDSKINFYGTNCPGYVPGPGYLPTSAVIIKPPPPPGNLPPPPQPVPPHRHPIYINPSVPPPQPPPPPGPNPGPYQRKPIGGCAGTQYGCCPDNITAKVDSQGSNCVVK